MSSSPDSAENRSQTPLPEYDYSFRAERILSALRPYVTIVQHEISDEQGTILGEIHEPLAENIALIRDYLTGRGFTVLFQRNPAQHPRHAIVFGLVPSRPRVPARPALNIVLFLLTVFTTLMIGSLQQGGNVLFLKDLATESYVQNHYWRVLWESLSTANPLKLGDLVLGIPFSFALLLILLSHELGHYLAARRQGVDATLPFFLPVPHPLMGTMGAFIRIRSPIPNRRALIRLGATGPLVGFLVALPIVIVGLLLSREMPPEAMAGSLSLGSSLLFGLLSNLFFPHLPPGYDVALHPLAFAGWLGFFVTALNLIPVGQLDGGHIAYVALGRYRRIFRTLVLAAVVGLGFLWPGWFFWGILVLFLGLGHPPTQDELTPIATSDRLLIIAAIVVFVLTFIPAPFPHAQF